jgi:hypothetical protein
MALKRCDNGHYFDPERHTSCPSCGVSEIDFPVTRPKAAAVPVGQAAAGARGDGKTVPLVRKQSGIDPVVGWLVCVQGGDRGRDFRLHGEKNFIGRAEAMDVRLSADETISRENHAVVSYNPKNQQFKLLPGEGRGLVYLNDQEVDGPTPLQAGDRIELGQTKLMFVPLCGPQFDWD